MAGLNEILMGMLAVALFSTIGLLATDLFQLRGQIRQLGTDLRAEFRGEMAELRGEMAGLRGEIVELTRRFEAHLAEHHST